MIGFIKHKVWVYPLAPNAQTFDNRPIRGYMPPINSSIGIWLLPIQMRSLDADVTYSIITRNNYDRPKLIRCRKEL